MKLAIATCSRVDELRDVQSKATALRAYYHQSRDVQSEMEAIRIRARADRRVGELLREVERAQPGNPNFQSSHPATIADLGMTRSEASRAMQMAAVPEHQFEAALAQPRISLNGVRNAGRELPSGDINLTLKTWGDITRFARSIENREFLPPQGWKTSFGIQAFQVAEVVAALPIIVDYLSQLATEE